MTDSSIDFLKGTLDLMILKTLSWAPTHGYGIARWIEQCTDDTLQSKSDDGDVLIMLSGAIYKVMPGDEADAALWLAPADVLVCNTTVSRQGRTFVFYEIINTDDGGEKVEAERLR